MDVEPGEGSGLMNPLRPPSSDPPLHVTIREELEAALRLGTDIKGSVYSVATYGPDQAQNPTIRLNGVGLIGLPVTEPEIIRLFEHYEREGERNQGPKMIPASEISLHNYAWYDFFKKVTSDACVALGFGPEDPEPYIVLRGLELYKVGCRSAIANDRFGMLRIVLPSEFTGGFTRLSYRGLSTTAPGSSLHSITALAWYSPVNYEVQPVESGACITLVYELHHYPKADFPYPTILDEISPRLNDVLSTWGSSLHTGPKIVAHLLVHPYNMTKLKRNLLMGVDSLAVQALAPAAEQHGFRLALGIVVHHVFGRCNQGGTGFEDEDDAMRTTVLRVVFGLDGTILCSGEFQCPKQDPNNPDTLDTFAHLREPIEAGDPHLQQSRGESQYERWYRRAVILLLPEVWWGQGRLPQQPSVDHALELLDSIHLAGKETADRHVVQFLLNRVDAGDIPIEDVLSGICAAACAWRDVALWCEAFDRCTANPLDRVMEFQEIEEALSIFGPGHVLPNIERILGLETDMRARLDLLDQLGEVDVVPKDWVIEQRDHALSRLGTLCLEDVSLVIRAFRLKGNMLNALKDLDFTGCKAEALLEFVKVIHSDWSTRDVAQRLSLIAISQARDLVTDLLTRAVQRVDFEEIYGRGREEVATDFAYQLILSCLETGNQHLLEGLSAVFVTIKAKPSGVILVPLVMRLDTLIKALPPSLLPIHALRLFYRFSFIKLLEVKDLDNPDMSDMSVLLRPAVWSGDGRMLEISIVPAIRKFATHLNLVKFFVSALREVEGAIKFPSESSTSIQSLISGLVSRAVSRAIIVGRQTKDLKDIIQFCRAQKEEIYIADLFTRVNSETDRDPEFWLLLFHEMRTETDDPPDLTEEPYRAFIFSMIEKATLDLGPAPQSPVVDALRAVGCALQKFFKVRRTSYCFEKIGAHAVQHAVKVISKVHGSSEVATCTVKYSIPRGLVVTKDNTNPVFQWETKRAQLLKRLRSLVNSEDKMQTICGNQWGTVKQRLGIDHFIN